MTAVVLILIDQQHAKEHPGWGPRNNPGAERGILRLLSLWREKGWPVVHVRHDSTDPNSPFRPGQPGNDFAPPTAPRPGETVVGKRVASAFIGTDLESCLERMGRPPLVVCGWLLANSVEATVRMAGNLGFRVRLPGDACWSCDKRDLTGRLWPAEDVHQLTLALLDGEYVEVTTVDEIVELCGVRPLRGQMHHIDLTVADLARSAPFYEAVLGFLGYRRVRDEANGCDWDLETAAGTCSVGIKPARNERVHDRYSTGLHHFAWAADSREDVDRLYALLRGFGATVVDAPAEYAHYGAGYYAVFFADPDGLKLEFVYFPGKS